MSRPADLEYIPDLDEWLATQHYGEWLDNRDFHSVVTVQFGELVHEGLVDWNDEAWTWDYYSLEQYKRLNAKIEARFWYREISLVPVLRWRREFIRKMNEIMPKYKYLYDLIADDPDWLQTYHAWGTHNEDVDNTGTKNVVDKLEGDNWGKSRSIQSEFPQTMLSGNSDYASDGTDREYENLKSDTDTEDTQHHTVNDLDYQYEDFRDGDFLEKYLLFAEQWNDVDVLILNDLESLFSRLWTVSINAI